MLKDLWKGFRGRQSEDEELESEAGRQSEDEVIKEPPMEIDGRCMAIDEFVDYVEGLEFARPLPTRVFLHHTWRPTPETWRGMDSILGMKAYDEKRRWVDNQGRVHEGWTRGPHLFIAQDGIWLFSDLAYDGVGVYGNNYRSRHIEMVGDYDNHLPSGPILEATVASLGILHERLGLDIRRLNFHRDFSNKTCPGRAVRKEWIIPQVEAWIQAYRQQRKREGVSLLRQSLERMLADLTVPWNPQTALVKDARSRGLLGALSNEVPMEIDDQGYVVQFFAQALLVPVNHWHDVQSLTEYERAQEEPEPPEEEPETGPETPVEGESAQEAEAEPDYGPPPTSPLDFQGEIR